MLIKLSDLTSKYNLKISGVIHVGACWCEELPIYLAHGLTCQDVLWFEPNPICIKRNITRWNEYTLDLHQVALGNRDDDNAILHVSNNMQSSSYLDLGEHKVEHPNIHYIHDTVTKMRKFETWVQETGRNIDKYNFLNIDVQGTELDVLKGFGNLLNKIDYIYLEVNIKEIYVHGVLMEELDKYLADFGYHRVETKMLKHGWGDAFYVHQRCLPM